MKKLTAVALIASLLLMLGLSLWIGLKQQAAQRWADELATAQYLHTITSFNESSISRIATIELQQKIFQNPNVIAGYQWLAQIEDFSKPELIHVDVAWFSAFKSAEYKSQIVFSSQQVVLLRFRLADVENRILIDDFFVEKITPL